MNALAEFDRTDADRPSFETGSEVASRLAEDRCRICNQPDLGIPCRDFNGNGLSGPVPCVYCTHLKYCHQEHPAPAIVAKRDRVNRGPACSGDIRVKDSRPFALGGKGA